jgi:drug/metabolite transporter (DMT)-like permease
VTNRFHQLCSKFFSDNVYGGLLIVFSTLASATTNSTTHSISSNIPPMQVLFFKCLAGLLLLLIVYRARFLKFFKTQIFSIHLGKGACGALGNWAWISAVQHLPLAESSALSITSAFFTSLGGMWFFKERFLPKAWIAIIVGFIGVMTIVHPSSQIFSFYAFLPLVSALFFSASSLFVKRLSKDDPSQTTLLYLLSIMASFAFVSQIHTPWVMPNVFDFAKFFIIGASYVLTQVCLIEAYTYAHASFIAPFKYARFPLNILTGLAFFAEIPPLTTFIGGGVILLSYAWLIRLEYKAKFRQKI